MTPTPRTDAIADRWPRPGQPPGTEWPEIVPANTARDLERELTQWQTEISKVMPPDFKDWWDNSKSEWPLVARLVIEGKNRNAELDATAYKELERELATAKDGWRDDIQKAQADERRAEVLVNEAISERDALRKTADNERVQRLEIAIDRNFLKLRLETERELADRLAESLDRTLALVAETGDSPPDAEIDLAAWKEARR